MSYDWFPVFLSLRVGLIALALILIPACLIAWRGAQGKLPAARVWDALLFVPLVLPPSVIGYLLVRGLGPRGPVGGLLDSIGIRILLTPTGAVLAAAIASG